MSDVAKVLQDARFVNLARLLCKLKNAEIIIVIKDSYPIFVKQAYQQISLQEAEAITKVQNLESLLDEFNAAVTEVT